MTPKKILITPRSLTAAGLTTVPELQPLREAGYELVTGPAGSAPTSEQLQRLLPGCIGYLAGVEPIDRASLAAADSLRVISRNGVGTDAIDVRAAREAGITIRVAEAANAQGVAELAVLHMLAALRRFESAVTSVRSGGWDRDRGGELSGRVVGIMGLGAIGSQVARITAAAGAEVLATDLMRDSSDLARLLPAADLLAQCDILTLHCPPAERPIIDAEALALIRPGMILINTARSALVDDRAVLAALDDGRLSAYAVDAFNTEPPEMTALLQHPNCWPTPHLGGYTEESVSRATSVAVANLLDSLGSTDQQR